MSKINLIKKLVNIHTVFMAILLFFIATPKAHAQPWTLQQCIDTAQVYNKNLQIVSNRQEVSRERTREARAHLLPVISASGDYKYFVDLPYQIMPQSAFGGPEGQFKEIQMGVPHNLNANIQLAVPIYNQQVFNAIETSKIAVELSELQYKKTEEQVLFDISNLYYNAQIIYHQLAFIDSNLVNTVKLLQNMQLLHSQLMVTATDVGKVRLEKEQLETRRTLVANNLEEILNALKFSMGISFERELLIESEILYQAEKQYARMPSLDFQLANAQTRLLNSELTSLKNSRLPSVSLTGSYGQTGFGYDKKPNEFLKFYPTTFAGVHVAIPLFNGTVTHRKINQKNIEIKNSVLQTSLVAEQNDMQTENAIRRRLVNRQAVEDASAQINLANQVYVQTVMQQKEGTATLADVLMADNALRESQQNYLSAVVDYLKADLELKQLTGNITSTN
jgi:OMF family outer membrane factor